MLKNMSDLELCIARSIHRMSWMGRLIYIEDIARDIGFQVTKYNELYSVLCELVENGVLLRNEKMYFGNGWFNSRASYRIKEVGD